MFFFVNNFPIILIFYIYYIFFCENRIYEINIIDN
jgi:hypothetical protein